MHEDLVCIWTEVPCSTLFALVFSSVYILNFQSSPSQHKAPIRESLLISLKNHYSLWWLLFPTYPLRSVTVCFLTDRTKFLSISSMSVLLSHMARPRLSYDTSNILRSYDPLLHVVHIFIWVIWSHVQHMTWF